MDLKSYIDVLTRSRNEFFNKTELKMQKKQAYKEAYGQLTLNLIRGVQERYELDSEMFGYENVVRDLLNPDPVMDTGVFDYNKPWDLSKLFS